MWTPPQLDTNPDAATARILAALRARLPGYETVDGDPLVILAEEIGREYVTLARTAVESTETALAGIGQTAFGVPAVDAQAATVPVRLSVARAGVIPGGFTVIGTDSAGTEIAFRLPDEVPATTPHVDVTLTAVLATAAANTVPAGAMVVATATAIVTTAVALSAPTGGRDAESRETYLDRLTDYLATLRPGGVRAVDMAALARSVPGVHRALGIDLHNPATPAVPAERTVTVVPITTTGSPVAAPVADAVKALLESAREVNFIVHVAAPTYTPVDVVFAAVAEVGANPTAVKAAVIAAVTAFLSPATWGAAAGADQSWTASNTIRYLDLARAAGSAPGVAYLTSLTLEGGTADVALTGVAALPASMTATPTPSTVDGTVV